MRSMSISYWHSVWKARRAFGTTATSGQKHSQILGDLIVRNRGHIELGSGVIFNASLMKSFVYAERSAKLYIGDWVFINYGFDLACTKKITIGEKCIIGPLVNIIDSNFHAIDYKGVVESKEVIIGRNVWISRGVTILPGVTIGDNAVIGVGSVVTKDIPPNVFAAGTPAKPIRELAIPPQDWNRKYLFG